MNELNTKSGAALRERIKATSKNLGFDPVKAGNRHVAERFLDKLNSTSLPIPWSLRGGLTVPQDLRPTEDADIQCVRMPSNQEMQHAAFAVRDRLAEEGILLTRFSSGPRVMDVGLADPIHRYEISAEIDGMRAKTHLDISAPRGPRAFPTYVPMAELKSFMRLGLPLRCRAQTYESQAAEKYIAVITQTERDRRMKHHADLSMFASFDLSADLVAAEIDRVAFLRGIPMSVFKPAPAALEFGEFMSREESWDQLALVRKLPRIDQAFIDVRGWWSELHVALIANVRRDVRVRDYIPRLVVDREPEAPAEALILRPSYRW